MTSFNQKIDQKLKELDEYGPSSSLENMYMMNKRSKLTTLKEKGEVWLYNNKDQPSGASGLGAIDNNRGEPLTWGQLTKSIVGVYPSSASGGKRRFRITRTKRRSKRSLRKSKRRLRKSKRR